jgi:hypothetical protein
MDETGENSSNNNTENVTSSFANKCKYEAKYLGVGVAAQVGLMLATKGILNALGIDLNIGVLTTMAAPGTMMITKLLNRPK